jgi:AcrR family transcriptional regulator
MDLILNVFKKSSPLAARHASQLLNMFNYVTATKPTLKSEETSHKILNAALELFRQQGFESTTMRDIAQAAGVATGAAYYYYESKDAIVMDFYVRSSADMQPKIEEVLNRTRGLEARLRELIRVKLVHFGPNRDVLRALLRNGADPKHSLSPFSVQTKQIRDTDISWFERSLIDCGVRIPRDLQPHLPRVLWFFQMGVILFWVIDESPRQDRTGRLLQLASKIASNLVRISALPLVRPLRKTALQLIEIAIEV